jgi:hypothetical protein
MIANTSSIAIGWGDLYQKPYRRALNRRRFAPWDYAAVRPARSIVRRTKPGQVTPIAETLSTMGGQKLRSREALWGPRAPLAAVLMVLAASCSDSSGGFAGGAAGGTSGSAGVAGGATDAAADAAGDGDAPPDGNDAGCGPRPITYCVPGAPDNCPTDVSRELICSDGIWKCPRATIPVDTCICWDPGPGFERHCVDGGN